jgi:hypothetical protein
MQFVGARLAREPAVGATSVAIRSSIALPAKAAPTANLANRATFGLNANFIKNWRRELLNYISVGLLLR